MGTPVFGLFFLQLTCFIVEFFTNSQHDKKCNAECFEYKFESHARIHEIPSLFLHTGSSANLLFDQYFEETADCDHN